MEKAKEPDEEAKKIGFSFFFLFLSLSFVFCFCLLSLPLDLLDVERVRPAPRVGDLHLHAELTP